MLRKKIFACLFILILLATCTSCSGTDKQANEEPADEETLQSYIDKGKPSDGEFTISYFENESHKITYNVMYESVLNTVEVDMTNLSVDFDELGGLRYRCSLNSDDEIVSGIRLDILKKGAASIVDTSKASEEENEAQKYAKAHELGIWKNFQEEDSGNTDKNNSKEDNTDILSGLQMLWEDIKVPFTNAYNFGINSAIIKWILASVLSFSFLLSLFIKLFRRRNIFLFFGGDKSAGKTTLRKAIMDETVSEDELLAQEPTNATSTSHFVRDDKNRRITIHSKNIDIPGDNYHEAINYFGRKRSRIFRKTVLTIVVAATRRNDNGRLLHDDNFIQEQKYSAQKFWSSIIKAKKVTKIHLVILFINKSDLYSDKKTLEATFSEHIKLIKNACQASGTRFVCIVGSSVRRNGIGQIYKELYKRR